MVFNKKKNTKKKLRADSSSFELNKYFRCDTTTIPVTTNKNWAAIKTSNSQNNEHKGDNKRTMITEIRTKCHSMATWASNHMHTYSSHTNRQHICEYMSKHAQTEESWDEGYKAARSHTEVGKCVWQPQKGRQRQHNKIYQKAVKMSHKCAHASPQKRKTQIQ